MKDKLHEIYTFLINNREYNKIVQENFYISAISPYLETEDRVINLLYDIANTQSQPNIDKLAKFFRHISEKPENLKTLKGFLSQISDTTEISYKNLYEGLRNQDGWGDKTSALFVKTIFHLHNGDYREDLRIWEDAPSSILDTDDFFIPVDAVIKEIFNRINPSKNWEFNNITKKIKEYYALNEIEVWDDLWFWGFITQKGSGNNRTFEWNENKYWMMKESEKDAKRIVEIKGKAEEFLNILR